MDAKRKRALYLGVGSLLDIWPSDGPRRKARKVRVAQYRRGRISDDWRAVGKDIERAMIEYDRQQRQSSGVS